MKEKRKKIGSKHQAHTEISGFKIRRVRDELNSKHGNGNYS